MLCRFGLQGAGCLLAAWLVGGCSPADESSVEQEELFPAYAGESIENVGGNCSLPSQGQIESYLTSVFSSIAPDATIAVSPPVYATGTTWPTMASDFLTKSFALTLAEDWTITGVEALTPSAVPSTSAEFSATWAEADEATGFVERAGTSMRWRERSCAR